MSARLPPTSDEPSERFTLLGELGRGGTATVWLVEDRRRQERVALKVVHAHLADRPSTRRRLARELQAASRVRHPAILHPLEEVEHEGAPALVLAATSGQTLLDRVEREGPLPEPELRTLLARIGGALAAAHAVGVLHRDVTPRNVLWDDDGEPFLTDFTTSDEASSFRPDGGQVTLADHSRDVRDMAQRFAENLGLSRGLAEDIALAAALHDLGKADPRFQQLLAGGDPLRAASGEPLAKSAIPRNDHAERTRLQRLAGYPRGTRHELMSVALVQSSPGVLANAHDRELVLHLVGSHHGWCRPFAPALEDDSVRVHAVTLQGEVLEADARHRLGDLGSGVADRFHALQQRYGVHGLAWLEAILRLADHRASESPTDRKET